ncbi:hypothetical protein [Vibrio litoralis]|uniref:hypothetical protein n=1 Tax=Vibrio litoralis TaxID=335972 RepID=UPI003850CB0B
MANLYQQIPEITALHFPIQDNSHQMMIVKIEKSQTGQGFELINKLQDLLQEKIDLKFVIICDGDVDISDWNDVIWAITTRMDPSRDTLMLNSEKGSMMGLDATNKFSDEVTREWGTPIIKDSQLVKRIDSIWNDLGIITPDDL